MSSHRRPRIGNLLALSVLSVVAERPMYPYQMATVLRARAGHGDPGVKWGTLYAVVQQLAAHELLEAIASTRHGRRPQRTVYRITDAGRKELEDWVRELVATPEPGYPSFRAALPGLAVLAPAEAAGLLRQRLDRLAGLIADQRAWLVRAGAGVSRLSLAAAEYELALREAELAWVRSLLAELA